MTGERFSRRRLLRQGGLLVAAAALWPAACRRALAEADAERLLDLLGSREVLDPIGRVFLQQVGSPSVDGLLAALGRDLGEMPQGVGDLELGGWLKGGIESDFREGRVVWIQGWELSLTEARLCGLAALGEGAGDTARRGA